MYYFIVLINKEEVQKSKWSDCDGKALFVSLVCTVNK